MIIVETRAFTTRIGTLLTDEEYRSLQIELVQQPNVGVLIPGSGGLRKLRWSAGGRGKRGGARIIYFWHAPTHHLLMLYAYAKNERGDLTAEQRETLRKIVQSEYP